MTEEDDQKEKEEAERKAAEERAAEEKSKSGENDEAGDKGKPDQIDEAKKVVADLKEQNDRKESLIKEEKDLEAKRIIGGKTSAGQQIEEKEETPKENLARVEKEISEGKHDD